MTVLIDANLLLFATFRDSDQHAQAYVWLTNRLSDPNGDVCLP